MTREEIQKDADNFGLPIERDIYELLADFAELMIKKREREIVEKLKEEHYSHDILTGLQVAIDIVEGKE